MMCDQLAQTNEFNRRALASNHDSPPNGISSSRLSMQPTASASSLRTLRKSYSCVETLKERQKMNFDVQPKKKYFKRFEKIFKPKIGEETLYNCYSCALYQDSIASGHLYLTFNWFCFYSNFMGRQRQIAINVNKIQSITQERTAKIIPNAIKITTDSESYVFSSFISRNRAYKALVSVWHRSEEPSISGEDSDLSDVDSMTRIVAISSYAGRSGTTPQRTDSDSTSETSIPDLDLDPSLATQDDTSSDIIQFTAIEANEGEPQTSKEIDESKQSATLSSQETLSNVLECKQWRPWQKVEQSIIFMQNLIKCIFCRCFVDPGESNSLSNLLIICTGILAIMTLYLGLRMFMFEQEQTTHLIRRQLQIHDMNLQSQVEATLELNNKLLAQMANILSAVQELVANSKSINCNEMDMRSAMCNND